MCKMQEKAVVGLLTLWVALLLIYDSNGKRIPNFAVSKPPVYWKVEFANLLCSPSVAKPSRSIAQGT